MTPLRQKMIDDAKLRNLARSTSEVYVRCVARFAGFYERCPSRMGEHEARAWLLHLCLRGRAPATRIVHWAALRFLYVETLGRPEVFATIPRPLNNRRSEPVPLTDEELRVLFEASRSAYDRTFFNTMLETGLRIREATQLQTQDIDATAGLIWVRSGKGGKPRAVPLSDVLCQRLRRHWKAEGLSGDWLFPAQRLIAPGVVDPDRRFADRPVSTSTMSTRLQRMVTRAGLRRRVGSHDLRRTFASRLLAAGIDTRVLQVLLGHASPATTARYTGVDVSLLRRIPSILESLKQ